MKIRALLFAAVTAIGISVSHAQDNPVIPVSELAGEFTANASAATAKYKGTFLTIRGLIDSIGQDDENAAFTLILKDNSNTAVEVRAIFPSPFENDRTQNILISPDQSQISVVKRDRKGDTQQTVPLLAVGQEVTVAGVFDGFMAGKVQLKDARLPARQRGGE